MKLAVLGTGKIVQEVLPILENITGIALVGILSTPRSLSKAQELAHRYAIPIATNRYEDLLASDAIDTIYIATPNNTHYTYAKKALQAGKNVICEKPFTLKKSDLEDLATIAKQKQVFLLEAITNQYLPNFAVIKEALPSIGEIKIVECNYSQYSSRYDAFKKGEVAPAFDPEMGGGALYDLNIYNIHLIVGLFGQPKSVYYLANKEKDVDTSGVLVMDFDRFKCVCIAAKDCEAEARSTIQGNKGSIAILGATNSLPVIQVTLNKEKSHLIDHNANKHRMQAEFENFERILATRDSKSAQKALEHSLAVMAVLDNAREYMK
ncbi:Gfo/Idh/MocA family protein [Streptococcus sciuri]|uniref:Gfo/Idh/MocA family oxidoreductase n=1 Tax=Streptococcus sciuri TaxID=2973939 RepID=A0ABT2F6K5_9STRE|nr:Gfo/Idh/MocA family oxidoreductase [Streptococcus sciuri]MCS4488106.1 Gfo/Idh/MocA family oxidoreductase [Streptococcus sciuri]